MIWKKLFRIMIYILPATLFFSYFPVIRLGADGTMNFELSLPLIWLVAFDAVGAILVTKKKMWGEIKKKWAWLLFPAFLSLSVLWSANFLRGVLTVGILWLIYFAGFATFVLRGILKEAGFEKVFWRMFFGSAAAMAGWTMLQCILDLFGVSRGWTLMCAGCTYTMFGFPHPNGFAIEPQFMGNLMIAPAVVSAYKSGIFQARGRKGFMALFVLYTSALFLTFSRGAIYGFVFAMMVMTIAMMVRRKSWRPAKIFVWMAISFLLTLNVQGLMAEVSKTNDTYATGVAKVVNHLSLGVIKIDVKNHDDEFLKHDSENEEHETANNREEENHDSVFDGYVQESTDVRMKLTEDALKVYMSDWTTILFGVGIGGAGQALYDNGLQDSPKEIVQNEYASLLLEAGAIGFLLFLLTIYLIARAIMASSSRAMLMTLVLAYAVTLLFFSGLPNALHIYLLPMVLRKKLVS